MQDMSSSTRLMQPRILWEVPFLFLDVDVAEVDRIPHSNGPCDWRLRDERCGRRECEVRQWVVRDRALELVPPDLGCHEEANFADVAFAEFGIPLPRGFATRVVFREVRVGAESLDHRLHGVGRLDDAGHWTDVEIAGEFEGRVVAALVGALHFEFGSG